MHLAPGGAAGQIGAVDHPTLTAVPSNPKRSGLNKSGPLVSPPLQHPNIDHFGPMYNSGGQFGVEALQIGLERHMKGEE